MVRRRVGSWQLAVGSRQLDVAIANGPSFRSVMAENATIEGDVVCATSSSLLTARRWSSRDWWMVDGGWVAQASLEEAVLGANEMVGGLLGFEVLGSGFWVRVLPGFCFEARRVVSTTRCEEKIYVRRIDLPPTTTAGCDSMDSESSPYGCTHVPGPGLELGGGA
jgi:hypothetical protein